MNGTGTSFMRRVALGFAMLVVIGTIAGRAEATPVTGVGDVIDTVDLPAAALCGGTSGGTAVAVVPGGKFGFPKIPILLVTSCKDAGGAKLFFLDPSTSPATLVQPPAPRTNPIITSVTPANGWGALAFRADQADLLACAVTPLGATEIYSIDFSPFNNNGPNAVPDGTTLQVLVPGPAGSSCNGLSWDVSNVSANGSIQAAAIYLSPSAGGTVYRITLTPPATATIPSGCTGNVTAMGVAGRSLFVACPPSQGGSNASIRQLNKDPVANGALVRTFTGPTTSPRGLAADPVSFASELKDVLWNKDQSVAQLEAMYIPSGTIGQALGAPVAFPAACPSSYPTLPDGTTQDSDGDGLPDCWEDGTLWSDGLPGINFSGVWPATLPASTAFRDLQLCVDNNDVLPTGVFNPTIECASKLHKDLFVEIDWMAVDVVVSHNPDVSAPNAIPNVVAMFAGAPVPNPDATTGIRLHVQRSDAIPHADKIALVPCTPPQGAGDANFDALKAAWFGTSAERTAAQQGNVNPLNAKSFVSRYGLFVHNQSGALNTSSGCAEIGGNDFMVSLGSWGPFNFGTAKKPNWHNVGTLDQQSGTIAHEFGHTLRLRHGGGDEINCKPNYSSVMNYALQFSSPINPRPLDYSRQVLGVPINTPSGVVIGLDKANLNESLGVGSFAGEKVTFGPVASGGSPTVVLVPANNAIDWDRDGGIDASPLGLDINQLTDPNDPNSGCPTSGASGILEGFNDWENVQYTVLGSFDQAAGAKATHEANQGGRFEIQLPDALDLSPDRIDFKPADSNNLYSANSAQTVSVAIFSRNGDAPLDATDIDPSTLTLRGTNGFTWVVPVKQNPNGTFQCKAQDINHDGFPDFVCSFAIPKDTITVGQTAVVLDGATFTGQPVLSSDFIQVN